jgi:hypothetical protein
LEKSWNNAHQRVFSRSNAGNDQFIDNRLNMSIRQSWIWSIRRIPERIHGGDLNLTGRSFFRNIYNPADENGEDVLSDYL